MSISLDEKYTKNKRHYLCLTCFPKLCHDLKTTHLTNSLTKVLLLFVLCGFNVCALATDINNIDLEQLLATEVVSADKVTQQISDAPSAVSVVTAQDIREYGYRNLSEILDAMRGLFVYRFNGFTLLGGRGLSGSSSLSGRLMLLVDGNNVGENFFNRVLVGDDSLIDVSVIDRVEYIPGAGSIRYGNSAFLGTINIITKKGAESRGAEFAIGVGTGQDDAQRITYGTKLSNNTDLLVSASRLDGRPFDRAFSASGSPMPIRGSLINSTDFTKNQRLFVKLNTENTVATLAHVESKSNLDAITTESTNTTYLRNDSTFMNVEHNFSLSDKLKSATHMYYGQYLFNIDDQISAAFGNNRFALNTQTRWWGLDQEFVYTPNYQHQILAGFNIRDDYDANFQQINGNEFSAPRKTYSIYMHDYYQVLPHVALIFGGRVDKMPKQQFFVPRFSAIWDINPSNRLKLSAGHSLRYQNGFDIVNSPNTLPEPEKLSLTELVYENQMSNNTKILASVYQYELSDILQSPYVSNVRDKIVGQELEVEHIWDNNARLRGSIAHQSNSNDKTVTNNYRPAFVSKLNLSWPIAQSAMRVAIDTHYTSQYMVNQQQLGGNTITNLTLNANNILPHTTARLSIRNLFNADNATSENSPIFNRSFWVQLEHSFP